MGTMQIIEFPIMIHIGQSGQTCRHRSPGGRLWPPGVSCFTWHSKIGFVILKNSIGSGGVLALLAAHAGGSFRVE